MDTFRLFRRPLSPIALLVAIASTAWCADAAASTISLRPDHVAATVNSGWQLRTNPQPLEGAATTLHWSTTDPAIATVDDRGYVTTTGTGVVDILVSQTPGGAKARCTVRSSAATYAAPWFMRNIGCPDLLGSTVLQRDAYTICGAGADIHDMQDECAFFSREATGDGNIIVRVTSFTAAHEWAKAGPMFRGSTSSNAAFVMLAVTPEHGVVFQWRDRDNAWFEAQDPGTPSACTYPIWLMLTKEGQTFHAYRSTDGLEWYLVGNHATPGSFAPALAGLAVTSHDVEHAATLTCDHLQVPTN